MVKLIIKYVFYIMLPNSTLFFVIDHFHSVLGQPASCLLHFHANYIFMICFGYWDDSILVKKNSDKRKTAVSKVPSQNSYSGYKIYICSLC